MAGEKAEKAPPQLPAASAESVGADGTDARTQTRTQPYRIRQHAPAQVDDKAQAAADRKVGLEAAKRLWKLLRSNAPSAQLAAVLAPYHNYQPVQDEVFANLKKWTLNYGAVEDCIFAYDALVDRLPGRFPTGKVRSPEQIYGQLTRTLSQRDLGRNETIERLNAVLGNDLTAPGVQHALAKLKKDFVGEGEGRRNAYFALSSYLPGRFAVENSNEVFSHLAEMLEHSVGAGELRRWLMIMEQHGKTKELIHSLDLLRGVKIKTNYSFTASAPDLDARQIIMLLLPERFPAARSALQLVDLLNQAAPAEQLDKATGGVHGESNPMVKEALELLQKFTLLDGTTNSYNALGRALPKRFAHTDETEEEIFHKLSGLLDQFLAKDEATDQRLIPQINLAIGSDVTAPRVKRSIDRLRSVAMHKTDYRTSSNTEVHTAYEALLLALPERFGMAPAKAIGKPVKDTTPFYIDIPVAEIDAAPDLLSRQFSRRATIRFLMRALQQRQKEISYHEAEMIVDGLGADHFFYWPYSEKPLSVEAGMQQSVAGSPTGTLRFYCTRDRVEDAMQAYAPSRNYADDAVADFMIAQANAVIGMLNSLTDAPLMAYNTVQRLRGKEESTFHLGQLPRVAYTGGEYGKKYAQTMELSASFALLVVPGAAGAIDSLSVWNLAKTAAPRVLELMTSAGISAARAQTILKVVHTAILVNNSVGGAAIGVLDIYETAEKLKSGVVRDADGNEHALSNEEGEHLFEQLLNSLYMNRNIHHSLKVVSHAKQVWRQPLHTTPGQTESEAAAESKAIEKKAESSERKPEKGENVEPLLHPVPDHTTQIVDHGALVAGETFVVPPGKEVVLYGVVGGVLTLDFQTVSKVAPEVPRHVYRQGDAVPEVRISDKGLLSELIAKSPDGKIAVMTCTSTAGVNVVYAPDGFSGVHVHAEETTAQQDIKELAQHHGVESQLSKVAKPEPKPEFLELWEFEVTPEQSAFLQKDLKKRYPGVNFEQAIQSIETLRPVIQESSAESNISDDIGMAYPESRPVLKALEDESLLNKQLSMAALKLSEKEGQSDFNVAASKLTKEELIAVTAYSLSSYTNINAALRGKLGAQRAAVFQKTISDIANALGHLDKYTGVCYRGIVGETPNPAILAKYVPGELVVEAGFTSTAAEQGHQLKGPIQLEILSRTGRDISVLSQISQEREVLFAPNTTFRCLEKVKHPDGTWLIRLEEVAQPEISEAEIAAHVGKNHGEPPGPNVEAKTDSVDPGKPAGTAATELAAPTSDHTESEVAKPDSDTAHTELSEESKLERLDAAIELSMQTGIFVDPDQLVQDKSGQWQLNQPAPKERSAATPTAPEQHQLPTPVASQPADAPEQATTSEGAKHSPVVESPLQQVPEPIKAVAQRAVAGLAPEQIAKRTELAARFPAVLDMVLKSRELESVLRGYQDGPELLRQFGYAYPESPAVRDLQNEFRDICSKNFPGVNLQEVVHSTETLRPVVEEFFDNWTHQAGGFSREYEYGVAMDGLRWAYPDSNAGDTLTYLAQIARKRQELQKRAPGVDFEQAVRSAETLRPVVQNLMNSGAHVDEILGDIKLVYGDDSNAVRQVFKETAPSAGEYSSQLEALRITPDLEEEPKLMETARDAHNPNVDVPEVKRLYELIRQREHEYQTIAQPAQLDRRLHELDAAAASDLGRFGRQVASLVFNMRQGKYRTSSEKSKEKTTQALVDRIRQLAASHVKQFDDLDPHREDAEQILAELRSKNHIWFDDDVVAFKVLNDHTSERILNYDVVVAFQAKRDAIRDLRQNKKTQSASPASEVPPEYRLYGDELHEVKSASKRLGMALGDWVDEKSQSAIKEYTRSYDLLNSANRGTPEGGVERTGNVKKSDPGKLRQLVRPFNALLWNQWSQLPPFEGTVYRGVKLEFGSERKFPVEEYTTPGRVVKDPGWVSASTEKRPRGFEFCDVLFVIQSKTGRNIEEFSNRKEEHEVLFAPNTAFQVIGTQEEETVKEDYYSTKSKKVLVIYWKEL